MTTCSIDGCDKTVQGRGWCAMHYQRWRRSGIAELDPRPPRPPRKPRPIAACSVEGCTKFVEKRGWCSMHLSRWKRHGTTDPIQRPRRRPHAPPSKAPLDRFQRPPEQCWRWEGFLDKDGYGRLYVAGKQRFAHRYVYEQLVGPIPEGLEIDHLCMVRDCVNPAHLEPVTRRENNRRMWAARALLNA